MDSTAVELSDSSQRERELVWNKGDGDRDRGGEVYSLKFICAAESGPLELIGKIAVMSVTSETALPVSIFIVDGVVGGKEEGGRDDILVLSECKATP